MDSPGSRFEDGANWPVGGASETASTSPLRCAATLPACYFLYASTFVTPSLTPEEDARGLSDDFEPGILVLSVFLSDRVLSFVSDLLKDGYDPRSGPCCPALGVCDPLVSVSFDCWLPIDRRRAARCVQRLGMEAVVACSARGLDLQCWRRPVFVLLPACQRCDDNADIDDTFGGVRSAGDGSVNERAGLGKCSGPDEGVDGVCDQRRGLRRQCCMIAVQRRWGVSDAERTAVAPFGRLPGWLEWLLRGTTIKYRRGLCNTCKIPKQPPVTLGVEKLASRQKPLTNLDPPRRYTARIGSFQARSQDKIPEVEETSSTDTARYAVIILGATHIPSCSSTLLAQPPRVLVRCPTVSRHRTVVSFAFSKASSSVLNEAMTTKGPKTSSRNTRISDLTFVKTVGLTKNPLPLPTFLYASPPMARVAPSLLPASILVQISIVKDKQRRFAASLKGNVLHVHGRRLHDFLARSG
ncbi:hypothetical protein KC344_g129 [Hortaea werneckii]|nr:hypothetical protein KC344_g129 [Hortaea werneckii]